MHITTLPQVRVYTLKTSQHKPLNMTRTPPKDKSLALNKYGQCPKIKHSKMNQTFAPNCKCCSIKPRQ